LLPKHRRRGQDREGRGKGSNDQNRSCDSIKNLVEAWKILHEKISEWHQFPQPSPIKIRWKRVFPSIVSDNRAWIPRDSSHRLTRASERSRSWTFNVGARGFFHKTSPSPSSLACSRHGCCSTASQCIGINDTPANSLPHWRDARDWRPPRPVRDQWCCAAGGLYAEFQAVAAAFLEFARAAGPTGFYLYTSSTRPCERPNGRGRRGSLTNAASRCARSSQIDSNSLHRARRLGRVFEFRPSAL